MAVPGVTDDEVAEIAGLRRQVLEARKLATLGAAKRSCGCDDGCCT